MNFLKLSSVAVLVVLAFGGCETTEPPPPSEPPIRLDIVAIHGSEVWLKVVVPTQDSVIPCRLFRVKPGRDTVYLIQAGVQRLDTILHDVLNWNIGWESATYVLGVSNSPSEIILRRPAEIGVRTPHYSQWAVDTLGIWGEPSPRGWTHGSG